MAKLQRGAGTTERHVRKSVTFDGTAGNGAAGTVNLFTITGRVRLTAFTIYCTADLTTTGAATISVGGAGDVDGLAAAVTATALDADEFMVESTAGTGRFANPPGYTAAGGLQTSQIDKWISQDIIATIATADINGGTLVFDAWYKPITDDGALVAA